MRPTHRNKRYLLAMIVTVGLAAGLGLVGGTILASDRESLPPLLAIIIIPLFAAAAILAFVPAWRTLDEMQQGAHLTSWYWGGGFGGVAGIITAAVMGGANSSLVEGAVLVGGAQIISFAAFWLVLRFKQRAAS